MLTLADLPIRGVSVGGLDTCIELPTFKLCFDIGRCPPTAHRLSRVLFTHGHIDHMGGVAHHLGSRDLMGMSPPEYLVPAENEEAFHDLLGAWRRLNRSELPCHVVPVRPGDAVPVGKNRVAHVFRAPHRVPTVGYAISVRRGKLRPDLRGRPSDEIIAARERGEEITVHEERVEVAFCGDTTIEVVEREARVRTAKVLVLEVTFLDERVDVAGARRRGHIHLDEVIERAELFENEAILLTHFSTRYGPRDIQRILDERLPASLRERVTPLLPRAPWA